MITYRELYEIKKDTHLRYFANSHKKKTSVGPTPHKNLHQVVLIFKIHLETQKKEQNFVVCSDNFYFCLILYTQRKGVCEVHVPVIGRGMC